MVTEVSGLYVCTDRLNFPNRKGTVFYEKDLLEGLSA